MLCGRSQKGATAYRSDLIMVIMAMIVMVMIVMVSQMMVRKESILFLSSSTSPVAFALYDQNGCYLDCHCDCDHDFRHNYR